MRATTTTGRTGAPRRWRLGGVAVVAAVALGATACSGDDATSSGSTVAAGSVATTTGTTAPAGSGTGAPGATTGVPGAATTGAPGAGSTGPAQGAALTGEQLAQALLTPADVGSGWEVGMRQVRADPSATTTLVAGVSTVVAPSRLCDRAGRADDQALAAASGTYDANLRLVSPLATEAAPFGVSELVWTGEEAAGLFEAARRAYEACLGARWEVATGQAVTFSAAPDPGLGDASYGHLEVVAQTGGAAGPVTWRMPHVMVLVGSTLAMVQLVDVAPAGSAPRMTDAEFAAVVRAAVTRLEAAR